MAFPDDILNFCRVYGIDLLACRRAERPPQLSVPIIGGHHYWQYCLVSDSDVRPLFCGYTHTGIHEEEPPLAEIVTQLQSDARSVYDAGFLQWAEVLGVPDDSAEQRRRFRYLKQQTKELREFIPGGGFKAFLQLGPF